jgi:peptidoglycan hydrolase-like protein with peptidoglycan-binding domain
MKNRIPLFTITIGLSLAAVVCADDNVREVQTKLSDEGLYSGEVDGAYSPDLSAALTRYQVRNGLPITGQLDVETAGALGAKPAVGPSTAAAEKGSETWRRLRKHERRTSSGAHRSDTVAAEEREEPSPGAEETGTQPRSAAAAAVTTRTSTQTGETASAVTATARTSAETTEPALAPPAPARTSTQITESTAPPATVVGNGSAAPEFGTERMRDYVAAFVLAGVEKNVGAEAEFFADRVEYYDQGTMDREKIREDLKRYDEHWPERHFWIAGTINVEPLTDNRVRVTFPLGFKLRNANRNSSGKVNKTLVLEPAGDDLQIVAVNEVSEKKK